MCGSRPQPEDLHAVRIAAGGANLVLGCDMVVAAAPAALSRIEPGVTRAVINGYMHAGRGLRDERRHGSRRRGDDEVDPRRRGRRRHDLRRRHRPRHGDPGRFDRHQPLHAGLCLAEGPACRCRSPRIERAIELNGVAVETSKRTFAWGRLAAHDLAAVQAAAKPTLRVEKPPARTLSEIVAKRVELLTAYQDKAYAERYRGFVERGRGGREGTRARPLGPRRGGRASRSSS